MAHNQPDPISLHIQSCPEVSAFLKIMDIIIMANKPWQMVPYSEKHNCVPYSPEKCTDIMRLWSGTSLERAQYLGNTYCLHRQWRTVSRARQQHSCLLPLQKMAVRRSKLCEVSTQKTVCTLQPVTPTVTMWPHSSLIRALDSADTTISKYRRKNKTLYTQDNYFMIL
jgi:hypothetical protein